MDDILIQVSFVEEGQTLTSARPAESVNLANNGFPIATEAHDAVGFQSKHLAGKETLTQDRLGTLDCCVQIIVSQLRGSVRP